MRAAADALGDPGDVEAAWLRGAAELVERGGPERRATRTEALWLDELGPEARAHKTWLLTGWVNAAEALRSAVHAHESERGPLVEALFPVWRVASLRRHADQALEAEAELQRRLASGYVVRRLAELSTRSAVGPALEALAAAGTAWAAERDRPALAGAKADEVRDALIAAAREGAHLLERVRWLVRAALARRPDLLERVFPKRTPSTARDTASSGGDGATEEASGPPAGGEPETTDSASGGDAEPEAGPRSDRSGAARSRALPERTRRRRAATEDAATEVADTAEEPSPTSRANASRRRPAAARVSAGHSARPAAPEPPARAPRRRSATARSEAAPPGSPRQAPRGARRKSRPPRRS